MLIFTNSIRLQTKNDSNVLTVAKNHFRDLQEKILKSKFDEKHTKILYNYKKLNKIQWKIKRNLK